MGQHRPPCPEFPPGMRSPFSRVRKIALFSDASKAPSPITTDSRVAHRAVNIKMDSIELHIFTNSTISAPSTRMIEATYNSFCNMFSKNLQVSVWCDPNPNLENSEEYIRNLKKIFSKVNITSSLSEGYIRAVNESESDFLFMLEHDWEFLPTIKHTLDEILKVINDDNIVHFRFNKRSNIVKKFDKELKEVKNEKMPYCFTNGLSNNPHIINKKKYINEALKFVSVREKTFGIEKELSNRGIYAAIYGPENYPATISHKDGKRTL